MITFKEVFIPRYLDKFKHRQEQEYEQVRQELQQKLPDKAFFFEMNEAADSIKKEVFKQRL